MFVFVFNFLIFQIQAAADDDLGTANSLYLLKEKLTKDCMLVSCDLISNINIQSMANFYRINDAALVMLLADNVEQNAEFPQPGTKEKFKPGGPPHLLLLQNTEINPHF